MKQQKWEDPTEAVKEFIDGGELMADDDSDIDEGSIASQGKARVTELRRRIEERLESKRIAFEYGYDEFDDVNEALQ